MGLNPLPTEFYTRSNVLQIAKELLGCTLHTCFNKQHCALRITETEAYRGWGDKACHAHLNKRTKRTEIMYGQGGTTYAYLCYGIHTLFNVVTNSAKQADAVLIRAGEPVLGIDIMQRRRG